MIFAGYEINERHSDQRIRLFTGQPMGPTNRVGDASAIVEFDQCIGRRERERDESVSIRPQVDHHGGLIVHNIGAALLTCFHPPTVPFSTLATLCRLSH